MSGSDNQPDTGRPRPVPTVLDVLRTRIDHDAFDAAIFSLEAVAADLGYGDVRPLPGSIAWIDRLRSESKRIGVLASGERVAAALELAGIADRSTSSSRARASSSSSRARWTSSTSSLIGPSSSASSRATWRRRARRARYWRSASREGTCSPEQLRRAGADAVVADLQELLGPT